MRFFLMLTAPRCPGMAVGVVSLKKSHDIIILSFCNIVKGQTKYPDITNYKNIFVSYLAIYISIFCKCIRKTSLYNTTDLQKISISKWFWFTQTGVYGMQTFCWPIMLYIIYVPIQKFSNIMMLRFWFIGKLT